MRLDKFLCELNIGSRSQVKVYVHQGLISVNEKVVSDSGMKIDEYTDRISFCGEMLSFKPFVYYMLNKPRGIISASKDSKEQTVVDLLCQSKKGIFPVGRLDRDTEGLLLLTNDGELSHRLLSPKKHVDKTYLVTIRKPLSSEDIYHLSQGMDIGDDKPTQKAKVEVLNKQQILLTICEGRFHQVKRMLYAVGNEVLALKRISFGGLSLDESLAAGESRELTEEEVLLLRSN